MDQISFNFASLLLMLTVFQGSTYALFLLTRMQPNVLPSRLLGAFTLVFSLHFANILLVEFGPLPANPNFNPAFGFCYGPLLLMFIRSLVQSRFGWPEHLWHLCAPVLAIPLILLAWRYWPAALAAVSVVLIAHLGAYVLVARRELAQFRRDLQQSFSAIDTVNLDWLHRLLNQMLFLAVITALHFAIQAAGYEQLQSALTLLIFASVLYFINALVLKGMSHPSMEVWLDRAEFREQRPSTDPAQTDERYQGSGLSPQDSEANFQQLQQLMQQDQPYLDEDLNIHQLAETLCISAKHLSQVINQNTGQSFYDYINGFRIEQAKLILRDPRYAQMRVSQVMYEVGYAAKSTFNSLFKQATGMTPTEYRRQGQ